MDDRRRTRFLVLVLGASVLAIGVVALAGYFLYDFARRPDLVELERVASPDGAYDAVLLRIRPRFSGGGAAGSTGHRELFVVEAGQEAPDLPRPPRYANCEWSGSEGTGQICQEEPADLPGSEKSRLLISSPRSTRYEIVWQDERTLEFRDYKAGEDLLFGCNRYPRELVHTEAGTWSTKMPDEVCAAENTSPDTD